MSMHSLNKQKNKVRSSKFSFKSTSEFINQSSQKLLCSTVSSWCLLMFITNVPTEYPQHGSRQGTEDSKLKIDLTCIFMDLIY